MDNRHVANVRVVVGNHVEGGYLCLDSACRAHYTEAEIGLPIYEGDAAGENGFFRCRSCVDTVDERSEVRFELSAPIPPSRHLIDRARALGLVA